MRKSKGERNMYNYLIYKTYDELKKAKSNGTKLSTEQEMFIKNMEKQLP